MSNSITQDMAFRQSLMQYAQKYGVSRASRKYNKSRSYIYFWKKRWDGSVASLACASRRPHSHPNQHTEDELKLIRDMRRRNPKLGMLELWHRLRQRGASPVPVHRYRRVHTAALSGGVSGAIHLFLGGLPAQTAGVVRPQRHTSGVCPDGQRVRVYQPFF